MLYKQDITPWLQLWLLVLDNGTHYKILPARTFKKNLKEFHKAQTYYIIYTIIE